MAKKKVKLLEYKAVFLEEDEGGYSVWVPALPGCCSQGETFEEWMEALKPHYFEVHLEVMKDSSKTKADMDKWMVENKARFEVA